MLELFPYVPLALDVRLGIAVCSYDGMLSFGITGDGDDASDIEILARGITHALEELLQRSATATQPPRRPQPGGRQNPPRRATPAIARQRIS